MTDHMPRIRTLQADERVLIKPLGTKGTVIRPGRLPGIFVVQSDGGGPPLPWHRHELDKL